MERRIAAGAVSGMIAGLVFDALMRVLPGAAGQTSMITFAAEVIHVPNRLGAWLVYPLYGVVIGTLFGWLVSGRTFDDRRAALWGVLYGVGWWIIAELVLIPALFAIRPFSASAVDRVRDVALQLLAGHVVYGVILGVIWSHVVPMASRHQRPDAVDRAARRMV